MRGLEPIEFFAALDVEGDGWKQSTAFEGAFAVGFIGEKEL